MSRPLRIEYPGAFHHVMNRGRHQCDIFPDKIYFKLFLDGVREASERFNLEVHAYCLMTNHYHLLVKTPEANLQRAMRHINGVYTQRYNKLLKTDGSLFRGRYKSILVDSDNYLLQLSQYIHLNPLTAGMVERLTDYPWSSYPVYAGINQAPEWLYTDEIYGQLPTNNDISSRYQTYVEGSYQDAEVKAFYCADQSNSVLGGERFIERIKSQSNQDSIEVRYDERKKFRPSIERVVQETALFYKMTVEQVQRVKKGRGLKNQPRQLAMYLSQQVGGYRLKDIAEYFGLRHYGGVSYAVFKIKEALKGNEYLRDEIKIIINRLDP